MIFFIKTGMISASFKLSGNFQVCNISMMSAKASKLIFDSVIWDKVFENGPSEIF